MTVPPFVPASPITLQIRFLRALHADLALMVPGSRRVDGRTVAWEGEDMVEVYRAFESMATLAWAGA
jgi:D-aminopeptidase